MLSYVCDCLSYACMIALSVCAFLYCVHWVGAVL